MGDVARVTGGQRGPTFAIQAETLRSRDCAMGPKFWELMIVLAIVVLVVGPHRLGGLGESVGKALREFREAIGPK